MKKSPKTYEEAGAFIADPELPDMLRQQLIYLAFGQNATVSFRAIELLLSQPRDDQFEDLDEKSTEDLIAMLLEGENVEF